jgi:GT2 family glycosyltransferase
MVSREKFESIEGFDERFIVCGGDVDLCIRLRDQGLWNVMTPFARLVHHESATRERQPPDNDVRQSQRAYASYLAAGDPFYNTNLTRRDTSCQVAL